jgi:UDPglucose 6-dehydrogenase
MATSKDWRVGVIGYGFLGGAIVHGFSLHSQIKIYDKYKQGFDTIEDTVRESEFLFFCLPTPMFDDDGSQDLSILEGAVSDVHNEVVKLRSSGDTSRKIAIIKSTVLPGTNRMFQNKYPEMIFVSSPEFLTARSNKLDFICAARHIFGGENKEAVRAVVDLFKFRFGNSVLIYETDWESAEITKYAANNFFMVKVLYFNFIYDLCNKLGVKYDDVKDMVLADNRISRSHCDVPGHDGRRAAGGTCFPKDINALAQFSRQLGVDPQILEAVWDQNVKLRPERDWEQMSGVMSKRNK